MKLIVSLDRAEDGVWIAECLSIPGCVSQGNTYRVLSKYLNQNPVVFEPFDTEKFIDLCKKQ